MASSRNRGHGGGRPPCPNCRERGPVVGSASAAFVWRCLSCGVDFQETEEAADAE